MDYYKFINSRDIEEYLRKMKYEFSPMQCAYLAWASRRADLEKKREAWQEIIATMPDSPVERRPNCVGWPSLHGMLRGYMAVQDKYLALFHQSRDNAVYTYAVEDGFYLEEGGQIFARESDCCKVAMRFLKYEYGPDAVCITKHYMNPGGSEPKPVQIRVDYTKDEHIRGISLTGFSPCDYESGEAVFTLPEEWLMTEEEENLWGYSFAGMYFDFPTPFRKGDVLYDRFSHGKPFVLMGMVPWCKKNNASWTFDGHGDMIAWGCCYDKNAHFLVGDYTVNYLDCEYFYSNHCHRSIAGEERLLEIYAMHMRDEIDTWTLLDYYRRILAETQLYSSGYDCELLDSVY